MIDDPLQTIPGNSTVVESEYLLSPYRILDLTDEVAVYGTRLLADWGAEVIKIEPPDGDPLRREPPFYGDIPHREHSLPFLAWNTNKKSITLNLHCADGKALFNALLPSIDAVVASAQPDSPLPQILEASTLRQQQPRLVYITASGFGQDGPHAAYLSSDLIAQAMGGVMWMSGHANQPPIQPGGNLSFILTGLYVATATMVGLWHCQQTGQGQHIDISQQDSVASILAEFGASSYWATEEIPMRYGTHRPDFFPNGLYACRDGYLMLIALPNAWQRFAEWVYEITGNPVILEDRFETNEVRVQPEARAILNPIIHDFTHHFESKEILFHEGQRRHFLFAPINTVADLLRDRHLQAREFWTSIDPPGDLPGGAPLTVAGSPIESTAVAELPPRLAPRLGQHNQAIYGDELGFSPQQLVALKVNHVI